MAKAIDVGCEKSTWLREFVAEYLPELRPGLEVTRLDVDPKSKPDILHDINEPFPDWMIEQYDVVYLSHVLEHFSWRRTIPVAINVATLVKPGGYLFILVPSLEWCAKMVLAGNMSLGVITAIYGGQDDPWATHLVGFTVPALDEVMRLVGCKVVMHKETQMAVAYKTGESYICMQHVFLGKKVGDAVLTITDD